MTIAASKWFNNAYLIWEMNGPPGGAFTKQVLERKYPYIYYREIENKTYRKKTKNPGWFSTDKNKLSVLSQMSAAIKSGEYCVRSSKLLNECRQYVYRNGKVVHSRSVRTMDDSAKGQAHVSKEDREDYEDNIPYGCMAWRFQEQDKRKSALKDRW